MRNPASTAVGAIIRTEVLLNSKRVVPYAMALLFGGNALLWWGWGPATGRALATNSEGFIAGVLPVFSFMTLPLFTAVIMGDPVIRDFRAGVTPLIFSKPVSRAEYLLGKFFGNFLVLVCCQAAFPLTLFVLQWVRKAGMIVQPVRVVPYFKHFLILVVVSHLVLAAVYFAVGTLTRNAKIVYGLAVAFYPIYITYQVVVLKGMPQRWRVLLDPLVMNWQKDVHGQSAEWLNQLVVVYNPVIILNRAAMLLIAAACLAIVYARFARAERFAGDESRSHLSLIDLSTQSDHLYNDTEDLLSLRGDQRSTFGDQNKKVLIPQVNVAGGGFSASLAKLVAALGVEFRLLRAERSLIVFLPLAVFFSLVELSHHAVTAAASYAAAYAGGTAAGVLLFLLGLVVFYTGEAVHRDRELRVEPVLWAAPAPNSVLILSKFCATLLLALSLLALVASASTGLQLLRGHGPVEVWAYLKVYSIILIPSAVFLSAASVMLNVLLRDKYLAYAASIGGCVGLFYLYGQGHRHWLYNPLLYGLWTYADLSGDALAPLLLHRAYCLALACLFLALAHLCSRRKSARGFHADGRLSGTGWSSLIAIVAVAAAAVAGLMLISRAG
ncbi:MAG TPA: ABC transporter permease [Pyrinomonadaceae bacterium]|jgi:ABC-type transport system involved in multi-copper enzyme maturation permease subunit|nr:ABC transporter permease [Pyrinomonadaceae bacterium]